MSIESERGACRGRLRLAAALLVALVLAGSPPAAADPLEDAYRAGVALAERGQLEDAVPYFEEALRLARAQYGADAPETAVEVSNLAEIYRRLGRYDEAEKLAREAVELDRASDRDEEPEAAASLNNLALILVAQGNFTEAEELHRRSLRILQEKLGPTHPDVARSLHNLAGAYAQKGQPERALPLEQRALAIAIRSLGPDDAVTRRIERSIAALSGNPAPAAETAVAGGGETAAPAGVAAADTPVPRPRPSRPGDPSTVTSALSAAIAEAPPEQTTAAPATAAPATATAAEPEALPEPAAGGIREAPPADGSYYAFFASFADPDALDDEWKRLLRRHPGLRGERPLRSRPAEGQRRYWRLLTGPYPTRDEAEELCATVVAGRGRCEVLRR